MFQEILTHLSQNKLRTALTGLSVSMGIFLLIFLLGAGNGLIHAFQSNMGNFATDMVTVYPGYTSKPYDGLAEERDVQLYENDAQQTQEALPRNITASSAQIDIGQVTVSHEGEYAQPQLSGVYPLYASMNRVKLLAGRFINDTDRQERRKVVVITQRIATSLYGGVKEAVGQAIKVNDLSFQVIGVRSNQGDFGNDFLLAPFSTLQTAFARDLTVNQLHFKITGANTDSTAAQFERDVRRSISRRHRFDPTDERAIWVSNHAQGAKEQNTAMGVLHNALWVIGVLTLLSGVVSISNIMLITVKERTHEFGIRKALGARPWSILRSVLAESVIITILSGYVGLVAGIAATEWMAKTSGEQVMEIADQKFYTFLDPTIDLRIAITALIVLIVAGLIAGYFPARRAVKVKPIEALNAK